MRLLFGLDAGSCAMGLCSCVMAFSVVRTVITGTETYDRGRGPDHSRGASSPPVAGSPTTRAPYAWYNVALFLDWLWGAFPFDCFTWTRYPYAPGTVRLHAYFIDHDHFVWTNVSHYIVAALYGAAYNSVLRCGDTGQEGIRNGSILCKACQRHADAHGDDDDDSGDDDDDDIRGDDGDVVGPVPGAAVVLHSTANASIVPFAQGDPRRLSRLRHAAVVAVVADPHLLIILCIAAGVPYTASIAASRTCVDLVNAVYARYGSDAAAAAVLSKCHSVLPFWVPLLRHLSGDFGGAQTALGLNSLSSNGERIVAEELITDPLFGTRHGIGNVIDFVGDGSLHFVIDTAVSVSLLSMRRIVGTSVVMQTPTMHLRLEREYDSASVPWLPGVPLAQRQFNHCQCCGAHGRLHSEGTAWRVCRRCDMR
jgi:hypothetical protein